MNIFEEFLDKIKETLLDLSKKGDLILPDTLNGITAEIPPSKFDSDISTNVAMVLSKINKKTPIDLANTLSDKIKKKDILIEEISVVKPGFINIKFKKIFWTNFIKEITQNSKAFGVNILICFSKLLHGFCFNFTSNLFRGCHAQLDSIFIILWLFYRLYGWAVG